MAGRGSRADQPDDAIERVTPAAERLNAAIDRLLAERRPEPPADPDEAELLLVAATFKQLRPGASDPRLEFANILGHRLREARRARRGGMSRREALAAGAALAAGVAGFAAGRLVQSGATAPPSGGRDPSRELNVPDGQWFPVARVADVPPGTAVAFTAGAMAGHLVNDGGTLVALSAICTHLGCLLRWEAAEQYFFCPCHGAIFGTDGVIRPTPEYPYRPPPLARLQVKVEGDEILVWSAAMDADPLAARQRASRRAAPHPPDRSEPG